MLKEESRTIGTSTYYVRQLDAVRGRKVLARLLKPVGAVVSGTTADKPSNAAAFGKLLASITEEDVDYLCDTFAAFSRVDVGNGKQPQLGEIFGLHFAGKYDELVKWLLFCLELNYGSFLGDLGSLSTALPAAKE